VALSQQEVWFGPKAIGDAASVWVSAIKSARERAVDLQPDYLEVRYEDLVLNTESALRRVCDFIELELNPVMFGYHMHAQERMREANRDHLVPVLNRVIRTAELEPMFLLTSKPPQASRVGRWKHAMTPADRECFEAIAGDLLAELGYETG
jgi:hypothetical protein